MSEELCDSPPQPCVTEARRISIQSTMLHTKRRRSHLEDQSRILSWFFLQLKNSGNYIKWILNLTTKKYLTWLKRKWSWSFFSACHRDAMHGTGTLKFSTLVALPWQDHLQFQALNMLVLLLRKLNSPLLRLATSGSLHSTSSGFSWSMDMFGYNKW